MTTDRVVTNRQKSQVNGGVPTGLDPSGVHHVEDDVYEINLCASCLKAIKKQKIPAFLLVNQMFLGPVPSELKDLTPIEESMIALCHAKCWIVQLSEQDSGLTLPKTQWGFHGNIIIYPQQPQ